MSDHSASSVMKSKFITFQKRNCKEKRRGVFAEWLVHRIIDVKVDGSCLLSHCFLTHLQDALLYKLIKLVAKRCLTFAQIVHV